MHGEEQGHIMQPVTDAESDKLVYSHTHTHTRSHFAPVELTQGNNLTFEIILRDVSKHKASV